MKLNIDQEYKALIPALALDEIAQLESNILQDGCRDPIVTWEETIIDGHNRYAICQKHGLTFKTTTMEFADRSHAKEWIIRNQFGRRNLDPYVRVNLALELESTIAARAKENQSAGGGDQKSGLTNSSKPIEPVNTRAEIAKTAGVSEDTVAKVKTIKAKASDEVKAKVASGEISINKAYQETKEEEPMTTVIDGTKSKISNKQPKKTLQEQIEEEQTAALNRLKTTWLSAASNTRKTFLSWVEKTKGGTHA
jgi:ParB-like chromosome segregation protein Spo0J